MKIDLLLSHIVCINLFTFLFFVFFLTFVFAKNHISSLNANILIVSMLSSIKMIKIISDFNYVHIPIP